MISHAPFRVPCPPSGTIVLFKLVKMVTWCERDCGRRAHCRHPSQRGRSLVVAFYRIRLASPARLTSAVYVYRKVSTYGPRVVEGWPQTRSNDDRTHVLPIWRCELGRGVARIPDDYKQIRIRVYEYPSHLSSSAAVYSPHGKLSPKA